MALRPCEMSKGDLKKQVLCQYFLSNTCTRGHRCRFAHDESLIIGNEPAKPLMPGKPHNPSSTSWINLAPIMLRNPPWQTPSECSTPETTPRAPRSAERDETRVSCDGDNCQDDVAEKKWTDGMTCDP
ncbi:unnamed protein product [Durusdinium trenchii]|uniref:C3H1-type domain-containing protein n=1 Tax=Durusdinium trenchii TaxID=1381693 RepID=A0ABP0JBP9_9DINO